MSQIPYTQSTITALKTPIRKLDIDELRTNIADLDSREIATDARVTTIEDTHIGHGLSKWSNNICRGGAAIASGYVAGYGPDYAFNSNIGDYWASAAKGTNVTSPAGSTWIGYYLMFPMPIYEVKYNYRYYGGVTNPQGSDTNELLVGTCDNVSSVRVDSSTDGVTWTPQQTFSGLPYGTDLQEVTLTLTTPFTALMFRLVALAAPQSTYHWGIGNLSAHSYTALETNALSALTHPPVDYAKSGFMTPPDKVKLDSIDLSLYAKKGWVQTLWGYYVKPFSGAVWWGSINSYDGGGRAQYNVSVSVSDLSASVGKTLTIFNTTSLTGYTSAGGGYASGTWGLYSASTPSLNVVSPQPNVNTVSVQYTSTIGYHNGMSHSYSTSGYFYYSGNVLALPNEIVV